MSDFKSFFKSNKKQRENIKIAVSDSFLDENGNVLEWEIRPISTRENERIREEATKQVPINAKKGIYTPKLDFAKYSALLISKSVVFPDLNDKELQESYGVMCAEDLVIEMLDCPGDYSNLMEKIQEFNGFDIDIDDKVEEAKN